LRAVFLCENDTDPDRPQAGGYKIYQIAITLLSLVQNNRRTEQPSMMHGAKALLAGAAMKMLDFVTSP